MAKVLVNDGNLTAIANAIRDKNGSTDIYKPAEMAAAISAISGGGSGPDIPDSAFVISGDCSYLNYNGHWDWFFNQYGSQITMNNVTDIRYWMSGSKIENWGINTDISSISFFLNMKSLKTISGQLTVSNNKARRSIFNGCRSLREIPSNIYSVFEYCQNNGDEGADYAFNSCYSLRIIPQDFIPYLNSKYCYFLFAGCGCLDEIKNFPMHSTSTISTFNSMLKDTNRLKTFTFTTNNGTPYVAEWKNHMLDFSIRTGWAYQNIDCTNYNSGITADKEVTDATTYAALKDNPDWFTCDIAYSRYNHDSAVATINSLPDTSAYLATAGGTNTIKFKGAAGSATDGGAINTLTEEEIAIATAKGWTVSLV